MTACPLGLPLFGLDEIDKPAFPRRPANHAARIRVSADPRAPHSVSRRRQTLQLSQLQPVAFCLVFTEKNYGPDLVSLRQVLAAVLTGDQ